MKYHQQASDEESKNSSHSAKKNQYQEKPYGRFKDQDESPKRSMERNHQYFGKRGYSNKYWGSPMHQKKPAMYNSNSSSSVPDCNEHLN